MYKGNLNNQNNLFFGTVDLLVCGIHLLNTKQCSIIQMPSEYQTYTRITHLFPNNEYGTSPRANPITLFTPLVGVK